MCSILQISSSGYYDWLSRPISARTKRTAYLCDLVQAEYNDHGGICGSPKIKEGLRLKGHAISRTYVWRLMKRLGIKSKTVKKYRVTTDSSHGYPIAENLLQRDFSAETLSQKWVGDITYIRTGTGWMYLSVVIDLADRKVIGWSFSKDMSAENTTIAAMRMAIKNRGVKQGLIFHSDRGSQYACNTFRSLLLDNNILQSMSRRGNCWDNAVAESFFKSLKYEWVFHRKFYNQQQAKLEIFRYIEGYYNTRRRHATLGYRTPCEMEKLILIQNTTAA